METSQAVIALVHLPLASTEGAISQTSTPVTNSAECPPSLNDTVTNSTTEPGGCSGNNTASQSSAQSSNELAEPTNPSSSRKSVWKHIKFCASICIKTCIAVLGLSAAWLTFELSIWTSAKDWKEYCFTQNETNTLSKSCQDALGKELAPPPGLSWSLLESPHSKRSVISPQASNAVTADWTSRAIHNALAIYLLVFLCGILVLLRLILWLHRNCREGHRGAVCQYWHPFINREPNPTLVGSSLARVAGTTAIVYELSTHLRKRRSKRSKIPADSIPEESEWLPAGASFSTDPILDGSKGEEMRSESQTDAIDHNTDWIILEEDEAIEENLRQWSTDYLESTLIENSDLLLRVTDEGLQLAARYRELQAYDEAMKILEQMGNSTVFEGDFERKCELEHLSALVAFDLGDYTTGRDMLVRLIEKSVGATREDNNRELLWARVNLADALRWHGEAYSAPSLFAELVKPVRTTSESRPSALPLEHEAEPAQQLDVAEQAVRLMKDSKALAAARLLKDNHLQWVRLKDFWTRKEVPFIGYTPWTKPPEF